MDQQQFKAFIKNAVSVKSPAFIRRLWWGKLFIFIALFGLLSTQAHAASFDCKKATTWLEKTVCFNPELSKLDEQMAKAYHDALASLSPEGQKETKQYQRQWLKKLSSYADEYSLQHTYEERIKQLQHILIKFPDRIFRNVYVHYERTPETCPYGLITRDLTYPQIEKPRDENEKLWNNFLSKQGTDLFKYLEECENDNYEYTVSFSNKHLISVKRLLSTLIQDASVPRHAEATSISWLLEDKRELVASDLFDGKTDWRNELTSLVSQKLKEKEAAGEECCNIGYSELIDKVGSPSHWVISKDGLGFGFREKYLEGFRVFIAIDWKTLDPYLSKDGHSLIHG